jgi:hypothetical protein
MQTVPNAGPRDRTILSDAPDAQTEQHQIAPLDRVFETFARWLYRITFVVAPACYVARLMKMPLAAYLMEATALIVIVLLLHNLAGYFLTRMHLVSDACFHRPASLRRTPVITEVQDAETRSGPAAMPLPTVDRRGAFGL